MYFRVFARIRKERYFFYRWPGVVECQKSIEAAISAFDFRVITTKKWPWAVAI